MGHPRRIFFSVGRALFGAVAAPITGESITRRQVL